MVVTLITLLIAESHAATLTQITRAAENKYKLPKGIVSAIIKVESNGQVTALKEDDGTKAQKKAGKKVKSLGLMQIQLAAARDVGYKGPEHSLQHPKVNVEIGARYLRYILNRTNQDLALALTCYNAGPYSKTCRNRVYSGHVGKILNAWRLVK